MADTLIMKSDKTLIPLWALVLGPFWLPIIFAYFIIYCFVFLVWILPVWLAAAVFNWEMPKGLGLDSLESIDQMRP